jgi:drug/metabolite transporter (DMT)-like permease
MTDNRTPERDRDDQQRGPGAYIAAAILIAVGVVFLFQNMGYDLPGNWWALFLLIPAIGSLASAWRSYERNGRQYSSGMAGPLIAGIVFLALTATFLFDLDVNWNLIWPAILIALGLGALARAYWR